MESATLAPSTRHWCAGTSIDKQRVRIDGKFFRDGAAKWYVKGFSYGPFAPNSEGENLPPRDRLRDDFAHMRSLGANAIRVYFPPPLWLLDEALDHNLRVFIDVPWEKHRCFFEDWEAQQRAIQRVRETARTLGDHPGLFAISVANEIPVDIIRFYGHRRVEQFIDRLIRIVKDEAPQCLATYVNFPTSEFLTPSECDFYCFNVYVHDEGKFGAYLDRLQHIAGNKPLLLGEYGIDTIREGDIEQAGMLTRHLRRVFRHGLAGSYVFAYTDDWFTGGQQIEDWAFGVTRTDRTEKPSAVSLADAWHQAPHEDAADLPRVSVVVCSYNGAATLAECLNSLMAVDYPDYEVILVDDGSTDATARIAADFPQVIYHHQENRGLSVARNVGAELASGEIVAFTDDDCAVDEHWLRYLVQAMQDQQVEAIGGPNITPASDGWVARCVAASPGNPSHVMLDDRYAEHVPGCNLAFHRETLLGLGGFDAQFRQAGDDVDVCWRLLDAGLHIGYAAGAMVWHHRRATIRAYRQQQQGYGRSEAMVHFKHPRRFGTFGRSSWRGIIYGDGAVGLPLRPETIYHGRFGLALFQTIYRHNEYGLWSVLMSLEWHAGATFLLLLAFLFPPFAAFSLVMWCATLGLAVRSAKKAPLPQGAPWWCRPLIGYLYVLQPLVRGWYRHTHLLRRMQLPRSNNSDAKVERPVKRISAVQWDLYWESHDNLGREQLLETLVEEAKRGGWSGDFDNGWAEWDITLVGDRWHDITIRTATEELGWPHRFTRARCTVRTTRFCRLMAGISMVWSMAAVASLQPWAMAIGLVGISLVLGSFQLSRRRCLRAATALVARAGRAAQLQPVGVKGIKGQPGTESLHPNGTAYSHLDADQGNHH